MDDLPSIPDEVILTHILLYAFTPYNRKDYANLATVCYDWSVVARSAWERYNHAARTLQLRWVYHRYGCGSSLKLNVAWRTRGKRGFDELVAYIRDNVNLYGDFEVWYPSNRTHGDDRTKISYRGVMRFHFVGPQLSLELSPAVYAYVEILRKRVRLPFRDFIQVWSGSVMWKSHDHTPWPTSLDPDWFGATALFAHETASKDTYVDVPTEIRSFCDRRDRWE
jgi:hypothetical protein